MDLFKQLMARGIMHSPDTGGGLGDGLGDNNLGDDLDNDEDNNEDNNGDKKELNELNDDLLKFYRGKEKEIFELLKNDKDVGLKYLLADQDARITNANATAIANYESKVLPSKVEEAREQERLKVMQENGLLNDADAKREARIQKLEQDLLMRDMSEVAITELSKHSLPVELRELVVRPTKEETINLVETVKTVIEKIREESSKQFFKQNGNKVENLNNDGTGGTFAFDVSDMENWTQDEFNAYMNKKK
jgi:hypothetical protein